MNRTRTFHNHRLQIKYPLSPLSTKMVITVEVVHTEETPYMKKLASTWDFGAYHVNFQDFSSSACFPSKPKHSYRISTRVANRLDPDQARHFVGPDLDPTGLQKLSADDTSKQRVKLKIKSYYLFIRSRPQKTMEATRPHVAVIWSLWIVRYFFLVYMVPVCTPKYKLWLKATPHK